MATAAQIKQAGYDACIEGDFEWQSPFHPGERGYLEWRDGWNEANAIRAEWEEANRDAARA